MAGGLIIMRGKVLFTKKNTKGIYGFITCDDGSSHYFDTSSIVKGNFIKPNLEVEFEVVPSREGKTQAINVQIVHEEVDYAVLPQDKIEAIIEILNDAFLKREFIDCAMLPDYFKRVEVNYKEYAEDIRTFVDKYLYSVYTLKKPFVYEGKTYPMALVTIKSVEIDLDTAKAIEEKIATIIEDNGFIPAEKVPGILKDFGINNYRDYVETMDLFFEKYCGHEYVPKKRVRVNGKTFPKIYVPIECEDLYHEEETASSNTTEIVELALEYVEQIKKVLKEYLESNEYITGGLAPELFRKAGVENYKRYARNLDEFIEKYLSDTIEMKRNDVRNGKCEPSILILKNTAIILESLQALYQSGDSRAFLCSPFLEKVTPLTLGVEGIQMALYMLADYLGEDRDNLTINDFHRTLIETSSAADLKQYKDDTQLLENGVQTSYLSMSVASFVKVFANIHNGKRNLNDNWNGIIERFWTAKSNLAVYLTCLIMIITRKDTGVDNYIDEAYKEHRIDKLPIVLKVYTDFLKGGKNSISLRLKKKIIGHCFDCHDINTLCHSYMYFDSYSLAEMSEVIDYLEGRISVENTTIISWFHGEIGEMIAEKITNYYWWRESRTQISEELIKVFSSVFWEYPENYFSAILYNNSCPDFEKEHKEQLLVNNFKTLCEFTKGYKKAFLFTSYVYCNYISQLENSEFELVWDELKELMKAQIKEQLSGELSSACIIRLFRYDREITSELENYYCNTFIVNVIKQLSSEDDMDLFISKCEELNLPFVTQWVVNNSDKSVLKDKEKHIRSLIESRRIDEAISQVQSEHDFSENQKIKLIKDCLCTNFELYNLTEAAYRIFDNCIPEEIAEQILLHNIYFADALAIESLICIYAHRKEWAKAMYLYIPFRGIHEDGHRQFITDFYKIATSERVFDKNNRIDSHYDVVKSALKIYGSCEFDNFIEWAKKIKIPTASKKYNCKPKTFDNIIKELLSDSNYTDTWHQLLYSALRTDNNEKQDSLRFCIITSFIGRFGLNEFEKVVIGLSKNKHSTKSFMDYYISLWKGLLTGKYSANFLRNCRALIGNAPLTFWNIFYDISVCKNHVFSTNDFELKQWAGIERETQKFYDEILERYSITRETVYLKIASSIISESCEDITPSFEQYIPFCSSNRNKEFLFAAFIRLVSEGRYTQEIARFLKLDFWKCEDEEIQLMHMLIAICAGEIDELFDENLAFTAEELLAFKNDFLECAKSYPKLVMPRSVRENCREYRFAYQYKLMEWVLRISVEKDKIDGHSRALSYIIPDTHIDTRNDPNCICYLQFISTLYRMQLKSSTNDIVYIRNRYYRLLISDILMESDTNQYSDDEIVLLMQKNKHFTSVYTEYKEFKTHVLDFTKLEDITDNLKTTFLFGVISNNWEQFTRLGSKYSETALKLIKIIEDYTNYRDLNIRILKEYIYDGSPDEHNNVEYVRYCSPTMYSVLKEIKRIYDEDRNQYEICKELLVGIAYLDDQDRARKAYDNMNYYLKTRSNELEKHWDMYINTLMCTSYVKTIINNLAQEIREHKASSTDVTRWKPVFASMNEMSIFFYLLSLRYAIERKKTDAKTTLSSIPSLDKLPVEWLEEKSRLEAYLSGEVMYFNPGEGMAIATLAVEKEATNVSFIQTITPRHSNSVSSSGSNNGASAYKAIVQSEIDIEDIAKYNLYRQLFSFVKSADDLYEIYRQVDGQGQNKQRGRLTYNEMVIEYGSLEILYNEQISSDHKMDILLEIFDVYQLLNDINKAKTNIQNRLIYAEQSILETPGVSFGKWLSCKNEIYKILSHEIIACSGSEIDKWAKPIDACLRIVNNNNTEMALLDALIQWRNNYNLLPNCPNYENAFVRAVDEKIQNLKTGVNLSLKINNSTIEDDSVFYQIKNISPYNNVSVRLDNTLKDSARLEVLVKINEGEFEPFEGYFSNELDLRANDTCGQMYRLPQKVLEVVQEGDILTIVLNIVCGEHIICNNAEACRFQYNSYESVLGSGLVPNAVHYGTAVPAFSATIKGFGREVEKADLRDLLEENLAIIYGPSRAGKSSLLNYIANDYLREYADLSGDTSFMRIRVADEQNTKNDYTQNMITGETLPTFENSTQIMEYLFLSPLEIAFNASTDIKKLRMCKTIGDSFPETAKQEISLVLSQKGSVIEKYGVISQILSDYHCQIWLMFDEFQQIAEKWVGNADELAELCTAIKYNQTSIKLVLCGSDELVRIFECSHDAKWDEFKVKTAGTLVFVGQLSDLDFGDMMNDRNIWRNVSEEYPWNLRKGEATLSDVLQSLYDYTGGNAICGKLLGEEILKKLKDGYFSRRRYLYPADITHIAYEILNSEASQVKNLLITHTTKNLQNERPYLLYIAYELASDIHLSEVSFRKICEFFSTKESTEIETALKLLVARGILKTTQGSRKYSFATLYYFDCYKTQATEFVISKLKSLTSESSEGDLDQPNIMNIMELYDALSPQEKYRILSMVYADETLPEKSMEEFKKRIANNYRDIINTQNNNNIQINAQTINTAFSTLLAPGTTSENFLKAFEDLPKLSAYFGDDQRRKIQQGSQNLLTEYSNYETCFDASGECIDEGRREIIEGRIVAQEAELEQLSAPAEQKLLSDTVGAVVNSDDFMTLSEQRWQELLGLKDTASVAKLKALPSEFVAPLTFAVVLHNVFDNVSKTASKHNDTGRDLTKELDYCPVAIMYCKIVEAMLKQGHTPMYIRGLGEKTLKYGGQTTFADLGTPDEFDSTNKDLSIGSYVSHLVYLPKWKFSLDTPQQKPRVNDFWFTAKFKGETVDFTDNIRCLIGDEYQEDEMLPPWKSHARALKVIHEIRNRSAHEAVSITKENFDWLIDVLFKQGELLKIWELAEKGNI